MPPILKKCDPTFFFNFSSSLCPDIFTGVYKLVSFDSKLESFLESLGLSAPDFAPTIRSAQVYLALRQPSSRGSEKSWTLTQFHSGKAKKMK